MNKLETRVEARWNVDHSPSLTALERETLRARLRGRISADGVLRVASQRFRTQRANKEAALERLRQLVAAALRPARPRQATAIPAAAQEARLAEKKRRAALKRERGAERAAPDDGAGE